MNNFVRGAQWTLMVVSALVLSAPVISAVETPPEIKAVMVRLEAARTAAEKMMYEAKIKANEDAIKDLDKLLKAERKKDIPLLTVDLDQRIQVLTQEIVDLRDDKMLRAKAIAQRLRFKEYTVEEWEAVISPVFTVSSTEARTATKLTISAGQIYLMVPFPGDSWQANAGLPVCDWKGYGDGGMRLIAYCGDKGSDNQFISEPGLLTFGSADGDFRDNSGSIRVKLIRVR